MARQMQVLFDIEEVVRDPPSPQSCLRSGERVIGELRSVGPVRGTPRARAGPVSAGNRRLR